MLRFKIPILEELKSIGINTTKIRKDHIFAEGSLTAWRKGRVRLSDITLNRLCSLLRKQPGELIEYVPDDEEGERE